MNKAELITYLRDPKQLSSEKLTELEKIVDDHPYFLSARLLLAKASKEQKHPNTKKYVASAAIYSTDRVLLKKYLNGNLFFLHEPAKPEEGVDTDEKQVKANDQESKAKTPVTSDSKVEESKKTASSTPRVIKSDTSAKVLKSDSDQKARKPAIAPPTKQTSSEKTAQKSASKEKPVPQVPALPSGGLDAILEELQRDMKNLKSSREKFAMVQQKIEEDDAVSAALEKTSTESNSVQKEETKKVEEVKLEEKTEPIAEEVKESATEITKQILEAAKKAKQEVDQEDKDIAEKNLASEKKAESAIKEKTSSDVNKEPDTIPDLNLKKAEDTISKSDIKDKKEASKTEERAERVVREPRFSRSSSRSYLSSPKDPDSADLLKDDSKKSEKEAEDDKASKEATAIPRVPDISKAKPVAKRKKKSEPSVKTETADEKVNKKDSKKSAKDSSSKAKEKKAKEVEKKPSSKKTSTKKDTTKKTTAKAKTSSKPKSEKKEEEKNDDDKPGEKSKQAIIDKFIKESPTIKYQRKENTSPEDLAAQSAAWDSNLASEYLAEIYLHQGNKKRAIEIYEALSLKYPEKKSYFADLISKIE